MRSSCLLTSASAPVHCLSSSPDSKASSTCPGRPCHQAKAHAPLPLQAHWLLQQSCLALAGHTSALLGPQLGSSLSSVEASTDVLQEAARGPAADLLLLARLQLLAWASSAAQSQVCS